MRVTSGASPTPPARDAGAAEARHLAAIHEELLELADRVYAVMGGAGRAARAELLLAAGRVAGAIGEIRRGAGR